MEGAIKMFPRNNVMKIVYLHT